MRDRPIDSRLERVFPGDGELARRMRALDWSRSELGPPERWPPGLRVAVSLCLSARVPIAVHWGPRAIALYNDACVPYLADPDALGRPGREAWGDRWEILEPLLARVRSSGEPAETAGLPGPAPARDGTSVRFALAPIPADDGRSVAGVLGHGTEVPSRAALRPGNARTRESGRDETLADLEARTLFARFMQQLPGLAWIKDPQGRYVYVNDAAAQAFRGSPAELNGRTDAEIFPPDTAAQFTRNDEAARASPGGVQLNETLVHEDGVLHHSIVSKFPIPGPDGRTFVGGMAIDVTDRKRAEEALEQSEERLLMALSAARMAAWEWRPAEDRLVLSENAADVFGYPNAAAIESSATAYPLVHPEDVDALRETMMRAIRAGDAFQARVRIVRADNGEILWMEPRGRVIREPGGAIGAYGVVTDVSERVRTEQLLLTQRHVLELVARGAPLDDCLEELCRGVERIDARLRVCVLLADAERSRFAKVVAPGVAGFAAAARELPPGDAGAGACAALVGRGAVACPDLEADTRWPAGWRALCLAHGLRAGCAVPIAGSEGGSAGAVLVGLGVAEEPREWELRLSEMAASVVGIALHREQAEQALRVSEERYRSLSQAITSIVWTTDPSGAFVAPQPSWSAYTGQSFDRLRGFGWTDALHPDDRDAVWALWEEARRARTLYRSQGRLWHAASRSYRHFEARGVPILDGDGTPREWVGTCIDVEDRERAARALRDSEQRFRTMANTAPTVLFVTGPDAACSFLSRGWTEFTGQGEEEALGYGWLDAVHPADREPALATYSAAHERREPFTLDCRLHRAEGGYRWILGAGRPRFSESGEFLGYIGSVTDVHDRKQAEKALREADRRKDEFLATLAHELRNPLAPLVNSLQLLRLADLAPDDAERCLDSMERQIAQMVHLIDDLLDVSRISRGKIELRREAVDLARVVRHAVETSRPMLERSEQTLELALPSGPLALQADATRLGQVFANLLNNAAKFGGRGGRVSVRVERRGEEARISVRDRGAGIPGSMLERIFDLFTQVDTSLERGHGGLGIGLTLVKRLVELHGGRVEARSDGPGRGSEFVVWLPIGGAPPPEASRGRPARPAADGGRRVLIADDNVEHTASLALLLGRLGHDTRVAYDGVEALEVAEGFRPDVVLLDLGMPRLNGYDTARRLRSRPWGRDALLVAVTGWGQEEDKRRSREAGFDRHLVKPIEPAQLDDVLGSAQAAR